MRFSQFGIVLGTLDSLNDFKVPSESDFNLSMVEYSRFLEKMQQAQLISDYNPIPVEEDNSFATLNLHQINLTIKGIEFLCKYSNSSINKEIPDFSDMLETQAEEYVSCVTPINFD